jgi:hypothetical protein
MKADRLLVDAAFPQKRTDALSKVLIGDIDADEFGLREMFCDFGEDTGHFLECAGPARFFMWPGKPGRFMGLPFRGHVVTEFSWVFDLSTH